MLPLPFYTLPRQAPLNLACHLPPWANPTDLGPKTYVAFGRVRTMKTEHSTCTALARELHIFLAILTCAPSSPSSQVEEHEDMEGDSVTKLHQDMSDAVNICVHAQRAEGEPPPLARNGLQLADRRSG